MLTSSREYQKALDILGSSVNFIEPAPTAHKRKATAENSSRPRKSPKPSSFHIDQAFLDQLAGGKPVYLSFDVQPLTWRVRFVSGSYYPKLCLVGRSRAQTG